MLAQAENRVRLDPVPLDGRSRPPEEFDLLTAGVIGEEPRNPDEILGLYASLLAPSAAWIPAELLQVSGVLSVVTAGIVLGRAAPRILSSDTRVLAGGVWQMVIFVLNGLLARTTFMNRTLERWIDGEPTLLVHNGRVDEAAMTRELVTRAELHAALREAGICEVDEARFEMLESRYMRSSAGIARIQRKNTVSRFCRSGGATSRSIG